MRTLLLLLLMMMMVMMMMVVVVVEASPSQQEAEVINTPQKHQKTPLKNTESLNKHHPSEKKHQYPNYVSKHNIENGLDLGFERETKGSLGGRCVVSKNCDVKNSVCLKGRCICPPHHLAVNSTTCLPGALLGFRCEVDAQCSLRVPHSACIQGYCRCGKSYAAYRRNNCLRGAKEGAMCRSHQQCHIESSGSYCNYTVPRVLGRCACSPGTCGHLRYALGSPCGTTAQCSRHIPGSICVIQDQQNKHSQHTSTFRRRPSPPPRSPTPRSITGIPGIPQRPLGVPLAVCSCPPGYLEAENGSRCIPVLKDAGVSPVSLGQPCVSSSQCQASDPFSRCLEGVCHCLKDTHACSATRNGCHPNTFQCVSSGRCISWYFLCDGVRHCDDGTDEDTCQPHRCPSLAHTCTDGTCVSKGQVCDGKPDCPDGSDEDRCTGACPASTFRCGDGRCLPEFVFCNATPSCTDGSDEDEKACVQGSITSHYCPFRCRNGRCRSTAILCSGKDGCGDNSDEEQCSVCSCAPSPT